MPSHRPLPERLGKYRVTSVLGEGAMGIVYKGFDPDIRREVALKTLRASQAGAVDFAAQGERFRNEARAAGRLQHPGIVAVYDYGRDGVLDFLAMEFVPGHTLSRYLALAVAGQLAFSLPDVHSVVGQLLRAIGHAHQQGVWHRDIKPSNLLVTTDGRVKVSDFGIARIDARELSRAASLVGTPTYMAPEQFQGQAIDHRVDLYAAGVVLYQLLTGQAPFSGSAEALMYRAVHEPHVPPSQLPGCAHLVRYDPLIARALAKQPDARWDTAAEFARALDELSGTEPPEHLSEATMAALRAPGRLALAPHGEPTPTRTLPDGLPLPPQRAAVVGATGGGTTGTASSRSLPTHFDPAVLDQISAVLARQVGPLASVMVRRTAREAGDLVQLLTRLAAQIDAHDQRAAFVTQIKAHFLRGRGRGPAAAGPGGTGGTGGGTGTGSLLRPGAAGSAARSSPPSGFGTAPLRPGGYGSPAGRAGGGTGTGTGLPGGGTSTFGSVTPSAFGVRPGPGAGATASGGPLATERSSGVLMTGGSQSTGGRDPLAPVTPALLEAAQRLLAERMGPIAQVLVRRAASGGVRRGEFIEAIARAIDDPVARDSLLQALQRQRG